MSESLITSARTHHYRGLRSYKRTAILILVKITFTYTKSRVSSNGKSAHRPCAEEMYSGTTDLGFVRKEFRLKYALKAA